MTQASELAAKNALLETRLKALASLKARRANRVEIKVETAEMMEMMDMDIETGSTSTMTAAAAATTAASAAAAAAEKTIEDEVADLEQEVLSYQNELMQANESQMVEDDNVHVKTEIEGDIQVEVDDFEAIKPDLMDVDVDEEIEEDIDETEEGELPPEPPSIPHFTSDMAAFSATRPTPSSLPSATSRRRRPGAEDLESRPISAPSRTRRKIFGAPQRANKLLISLDNDSDSSDSESEEDKMMAKQKRLELLRRLAEEKQNSPGPFPIPLALPTPLSGEMGSGSRRGSVPHGDADALADHEEKIRLLKEQIALKMKAKDAARMRSKRDGSTGSTGSSRTGSETPDMPPMVLANERMERAGSPLKQEMIDGVNEMEVEETESRRETTDVEMVAVEVEAMEIQVVVAADEVKDMEVQTLPDVPSSTTGKCRQREWP